MKKNFMGRYTPPILICSAIWFKDGIKRELMTMNIDSGIVVCGWRHGNCITILNAIFPNREYILKNKDDKTTIQGFLTSDNRFVDRVEGGKIAFKAGQTFKLIDYLFSEDLY